MPYRLKSDRIENQARYRQSPHGKATKRASTLIYRARIKKEKAGVRVRTMPASSIQKALSTWGNTK